MRSLRLISLGALLVVLGIQLFGFKIAVDAVGWLVAIIGLNQVARQHRFFRWARIISALALLATFVFYLNLEARLTLVLGAVAQLCLVVFAFLICGAISQKAREIDPQFADAARILRWTSLATGLATYVVTALSAVSALSLGIVAANLLVYIAFAVLCWLAYKRFQPLG